MSGVFAVAIGFGFGYAMYRHAPYMVIGGSGWVPLIIMFVAGFTAFLCGRRLGQRQYQWQQQHQEQTQQQAQTQALHVHLGGISGGVPRSGYPAIPTGSSPDLLSVSDLPVFATVEDEVQPLEVAALVKAGELPSTHERAGSALTSRESPS